MRVKSKPLFALTTVAAFLLQACGGNGSSIPAPVIAPLFGSGVTLQTGSIQLPAGSNVAASSLTVTNSLGSATVSSSGNFGLNALSGGPQFAQVLTASGNPMLMGFLSPAEPVISAHTTAEVLIFIAGGLYQLPQTERDQAYAAISTTPGFSNVENAIGAELALNPDAFGSAGGEKIVAAAVTQFFASVHASAAAPKDILVDPSNGQSGVTVLNNNVVQITFANTYRRPSRAFIDEVSYANSSGSATTIVPVSVSDVVPAVDIPAATALKSFKSTLVDISNGKYAWSQVSTSPVTLTPNPGSVWTRYAVTVVGPGFSDGAKSSLSADRLKAQDDLTLNFLVQDLVIPEISSILIPLSSMDKIGPLAGPITKDIISALASDIPNVRTAYQGGDYGGAVVILMTAIAKSSTVQKTIINDFITAAGETDPAIQAQWAKNFGGALQGWLKITDMALVGADILKLTADAASSDQADIFTVYALPVKILLTPGTTTLDNDATAHLTANVPAAGGSDLELEYTWGNTATAGHFYQDFVTKTPVDNYTCHTSCSDGFYTANHTGGGTDTVTVSIVAFDNSGNKPEKFSLGSASATITIATPSPSPSPDPGSFGTPPTNLPQSRCAGLAVSPHESHVGATISGTVSSAGPMACGGDLPDGFPPTWKWSGQSGQQIISGCTDSSLSCVFQGSVTGSPGNRYVQLCLNGNSRQGQWISCDYYGVAP